MLRFKELRNKMEKNKIGSILIVCVSLLFIIIVGYNLLVPSKDDALSDSNNQFEANSISTSNDVDAEDVFNFVADNYYAYYADDEYLTKSQSEYQDETFREAAQKFGISESKARDLYDEYAKELGLDGSDSIDDSSDSSSNSYSDYTHYSDYDYSSDDEPEYYYQKGDTYSARYDDDNDGKVSEDEYMQGMSDLIDDLYANYVKNN